MKDVGGPETGNHNGQELKWQRVKIQAANGKWYNAKRLLEGPEGFRSNCHADSLGLRGEVWIDPADFSPILRTFYKKTKTPDLTPGNLVAFYGSTRSEMRYDPFTQQNVQQNVYEYVHSGILDSVGMDLASSTWRGDDGGFVPPITPSPTVSAASKLYNNAEASTWIRK